MIVALYTLIATFIQPLGARQMRITEVATENGKAMRCSHPRSFGFSRRICLSCILVRYCSLRLLCARSFFAVTTLRGF